MANEASSPATATTHANEALYQAMAKDLTLSPEMVNAKAIAILHAAIRRLPEQQSPARCQQETTHRYI
jgi:hypothetical protein